MTLDSVPGLNIRGMVGEEYSDPPGCSLLRNESDPFLFSCPDDLYPDVWGCFYANCGHKQN